jgi:ketosteroid isomerase-like protein
MAVTLLPNCTITVNCHGCSPARFSSSILPDYRDLKKGQRMGSMDTLKATFEQMIAAYSARDLDRLAAHTHSDVIFLGVLAPVHVEGKAPLRSLFRNFFDTHSYVQLTPLDPRFQVTETIGLVWGSMMLEIEAKRLERKTLYLRFSCTFGNFADKWQLINMHTSWMPQEG